jgi:hypothetical protein
MFVKGEMQPNGGPMSFPVQLWLDAGTSLPVKRVITQKLMDGAGTAHTGMVVTETCRKVVSGAGDPKTFEVPKATDETIIERWARCDHHPPASPPNVAHTTRRDSPAGSTPD